MRDVKGQDQAKRALEIAAAGGHNLAFIGPLARANPLLAKRLPGILPDLSSQEALEVTMVHSLAGWCPAAVWSLRAPTATHIIQPLCALVGGGPKARPGEISLCHRGVLFLDELPEFKRDALEALRQPIENGQVTISRAAIKRPIPLNSN